MDNLTYEGKQFSPTCLDDEHEVQFVENIFSSVRLFTICTNLFSRYSSLKHDRDLFLEEGKEYVSDFIGDLSDMLNDGEMEEDEVKNEKVRLSQLEHDLAYISNVSPENYQSLRADCLELITERYLRKKYSIEKMEIHHEAKIYVNDVAKPNINYSYNATSSDFSFDKNNLFVMYECKADIAQFIRRIEEQAYEVTTSFANISNSNFAAKIEQTIDEINYKGLKKIFYLLYFKETIINLVSNLIRADVFFTTFTSKFVYSQQTAHIKEVELKKISGSKGAIQVLSSNEMEALLFNF